jgi:hypothetical protein
MAILMTESSLISHGLVLLRWFIKKDKQTWQIMMPPNIKSWLRRKALSSPAGVREMWVCESVPRSEEMEQLIIMGQV